MAEASAPSAPAPHGMASSAWRFVLAGGANTLVTGALLSVASLVMDPRLAYTLVFTAGLVLSTYLADRFVYGVRLTRRAVLAYVAMYVAVYLVGLVVVDRLVAAGLPSTASGLVVLVTAPLTFLGGRALARWAHRARSVPVPPEPTP